MSERENPLNPNPTSGGSTASPSLPSDPADLPPPPPAAAQNNENEDDDDGVEDANEKLANVKITDDEEEEEAKDAATKAASSTFSFNFNKQNDDDDDDEEAVELEEGYDAPPDILSTLPPIVLKRVDKLKELNQQREEMMEEYLKERAALEQKFALRCKPLYEERNAIVNGDTGDNDEVEESEEKEGVVVVEEVNEGDEDEGSETSESEEKNLKGIPQFWLCAMGHMEAVGELVTEPDVPCLEHLINVTCEDHDNGQGFTLKFHFDATNNPYFTNEVLTKKYEIPNLLLEDEPILKNVEGCTIHWKPGKSLTHREVKKKQRSKSGRRAGQIRVVTKKERIDSFFHFFIPPKMPSMETLDEEEADAIEEAFDHDYDVAQAFRSHLIPKAVLWFTGEALDEIDEALLESALIDGAAGAEGGFAQGSAASPFPPPSQEGQNSEECKQN